MRDPKPWYRKSTDAWYAQVNRKQVRLANGRDNRAEAKQKLASILAGIQPLKTNTLTVAQLCDRYLSHSQSEHAAETFTWQKGYLQKFCDTHGSKLASELIPHHLTEWIASYSNWKASRRHARAVVKRSFEWARKEGLIAKNPFTDVVVGKCGRRERILTKAEREEILAAVRDQAFRDFLVALQETGCRPSEVARVTAADVNLELGIWTLTSHKTAKKTGRDRIVFLVTVHTLVSLLSTSARFFVWNWRHRTHDDTGHTRTTGPTARGVPGTP